MFENSYYRYIHAKIIFLKKMQKLVEENKYGDMTQKKISGFPHFYNHPLKILSGNVDIKYNQNSGMYIPFMKYNLFNSIKYVFI